jgi:hypothetical protein
VPAVNRLKIRRGFAEDRKDGQSLPAAVLGMDGYEVLYGADRKMRERTAPEPPRRWLESQSKSRERRLVRQGVRSGNCGQVSPLIELHCASAFASALWRLCHPLSEGGQISRATGQFMDGSWVARHCGAEDSIRGARIVSES